MAALGWLPGIRIDQAESWEDVGIIKEAVNLAEEKATAKTSVLLEETRIFEAPKDLAENSNVMKWMKEKGFKTEREMRLWCSANYIQFWGEMAKTYADWFEPWSSTLEWKPPYAKWFVGGKCNVTHNCVDRHAQGAKKDKVAYIFVPEPTDQPTQKITYAQLEKEVNKFANGLKSLGVVKGDRVMLYMPMIPQLPIAMLAIAKIGAIHCIVFSGFSSGGLNSRIMDAEAKVVITVDGFYRRGKPLRECTTDDMAGGWLAAEAAGEDAYYRCMMREAVN